MHGLDRPVVFLGSYPPRECGIATFTQDLYQGFESIRREFGFYRPARVLAMGDGRAYAYPAEVRGEMAREGAAGYREFARRLGGLGTALVNVQHEYGLFGGPNGELLLEFLEWLKPPVVTTLHTLLISPPSDLVAVARSIADRSQAVVVLARCGLELARQQGLDPQKLVYIPHGVPFVARDREARQAARRRLGLEGRTVLATFGLISRDKGIEYVLQALPELVKCHPDLLYVVVGETHPAVRRYEGESYREELMAVSHRLGLSDHVEFRAEYQTRQDFCRYLQAAHVCVLPYLARDQIVSGTLSYAMAAGRVVVSTPSLFAEECLAGGRGALVPFRDAGALEEAIGLLLESPELRREIEWRAWNYTRSRLWPEVGRRYAGLFGQVLGVGTAHLRVPDKDRLVAGEAAGRQPPLHLGR